MKNYKYSLFIAGLVIILLSSINYVSHAQDLSKAKIAVLNMQIALTQSFAGQASKAKLQKKAKSMSGEFGKKEGQLLELSKSLESSLISDSARKTKLSELEVLRKDYLKFRQDSEEELRKEELKYTEEIFKELKILTDKIAKQKKYDLVLEQSLYSALLYHNLTVTNITDEVIEEYNNNYNQKN